MKLIVLIDNTANSSLDLLTEHGLSIYFECDDRKWLMDVGASGKFADNAQKLGVDIADIDYLVLSHAHSDHTGGLEEFIRRNTKAQIFISSHLYSHNYYSTRSGSKRNISPDSSVLQRHRQRFVLVDTNTQLSLSVTLHCNIKLIFDIPKANHTLLADGAQDDFIHEMALCIDTPAGRVIISPCSHLGVLNTLQACGHGEVAAYIGGTHMKDSCAENEYETDEQLAEIAESIMLRYPNMKLISGHCIGQNAQRIFSEMMAENFELFYSGFNY